MKALHPPLAVLLLLAACDSATTSGAADEIRIRMGAAPGSAAASPARVGAAAAGPLVLSGDNGELTITSLHVVVAEFQLDGDDDVNACQAEGGSDDCEDFEAGPLFVDLPLSGAITVSSGVVPPGTYDELEFEIEDLDDDEEDAAEAARIATLFQQIRSEFADWPRDASMRVEGSFRPMNGGVLGAPQPFTVYLEAEVEIELELQPPLVVTANDAGGDVNVTLDPQTVFRTGTQVVDLSRFNGQLVEWELERGFRGDHSGHQ